MNKRDYHEIFDEIDPEDQAIADLLRRTSFAPSPTYQANLWKKLTHYQNQPYYERKARMSSSLWTILSSKTLRLGLTAAVSSALTVIIILGATLVFSPQARAQAQQLIARFVEVDSPMNFLAEQIKKDQEALKIAENSVAPAEDSDGAAKGAELSENGDNSVTPLSESAAPWPNPPAPTGGASERVGGLPASGQPAPAGASIPTLQGSGAHNIPTLVSLEEAQSRVSFTIRTPTWLPEGYSLKGIMVPPDLANTLSELPRPTEAPSLPTPAIATLNYSNDNGDSLILSQVKGPQLELPNSVSKEVLLPVPKDKGTVQEITINGQAGQYVEMGPGRQLHWQDAEGVMYDLMSTTLDQATLIHIAESIN